MQNRNKEEIASFAFSSSFFLFFIELSNETQIHSQKRKVT
jgi:hypothetical protein